MRTVRNGGTVILFGGCAAGSTARFDTSKLHYGEVSLIGSFHYTPADARDAFRLLAEGEIDPGPLMSGTISLDEVESGLERMMARQALKLAVHPGADRGASP